MAGSIQLSGSQQFDSQGRPLSGGLLYFFASGTTTPQNAYQDQALSIAYTNPIVLDSSGRVPFFYLADGNIKIRLTDSSGVTIIAADGLLVIGPSSGGGGGGGVDATTVLATGDMKARYGTGSLTGFVRCNGRTIGSATSGASERANADCQSLFEYLWGADANLTVSTGRGATANADWLANKTITLPDMRGRVWAGMDDMGATAASRLTSSFFGSDATVLGAGNGAESKTLTQAQLPSYNLSLGSVTWSQTGGGTSGSSATGITINAAGTGITASVDFQNSGAVTTGGTPNYITTGTTAVNISDPTHTHGYSDTGHTHSVSVSGAVGGTLASGGSGTAHAIVQPTMVVTFYMKL